MQRLTHYSLINISKMLKIKLNPSIKSLYRIDASFQKVWLSIYIYKYKNIKGLSEAMELLKAHTLKVMIFICVNGYCLWVNFICCS